MSTTHLLPIVGGLVVIAIIMAFCCTFVIYQRALDRRRRREEARFLYNSGETFSSSQDELYPG